MRILSITFAAGALALLPVSLLACPAGAKMGDSAAASPDAVPMAQKAQADRSQAQVKQVQWDTVDPNQIQEVSASQKPEPALKTQPAALKQSK